MSGTVHFNVDSETTMKKAITNPSPKLIALALTVLLLVLVPGMRRRRR